MRGDRLAGGVADATLAGVTIKAVLGPTNTGKTHLAIERMCGHSSGAIGFPLRLLAREVYDRVVAIKGEKAVALITGEERIEPKDARYFCCTAEAMPRTGGGHAFVALDEAQLAADRERGHIFTDRLLNARGREETMLLGSSTLEPMVRALIPRAEIVTRPRFSTLRYAGTTKLSRLPPRSAVVAFSTEQVYAVAEMLRRFRGGAAVVMGGLSPETRNKQVALFQSGEVDYIVATDAIGMGLNLDVRHVAFAGLSKFDGVRQRRLTPAEMAQIAGRAGRHQTDGTFGALSGAGANSPEFTDEEVYAIEEHRFAPLTSLYWREAEPRYDTLAALIEDLEAPPGEPGLVRAPEAIDLAVLKRLAEEPLAGDVTTPGLVRRFWEVCSLPDFRQSGADTHARFVARLWQDLRHGHLGADYMAARIAELDRPQGDIDTLQGRIASIRSWAYIAQRPDWVLARDEMAARARAVEARLSDALHARLTERFVNRRTAILMKSLGTDPALLPVALADDDVVTVEGEAIGHLEGFRFVVDPLADHADRKMLLAAAEKALPRLLAQRALALSEDMSGIELSHGRLRWRGRELAVVERGASATTLRILPSRDLAPIPEAERKRLVSAIEAWLAVQLSPLAPLAKIEQAARDPAAGSEARALLLNLVAGHGAMSRERVGIEHLPREARPYLRRLGVVFGALDVFAPALLKPAARAAFAAAGIDRRPLAAQMPSVLSSAKNLPAGYRSAGEQAVRVDVADKLVRTAHEARVASRTRNFTLDPALAVSTGLRVESWARLLGAAGFKVQRGRKLPTEAFGPPTPDRWSWRPARRGVAPVQAKPRQGSAFAALADLAL
ncbi:helicase-related protein [Tsuneonella dongtanensis]|uniref:helicase-related protein n=1 Tax=Tsuneonella dongtanensis TaxID=692370 RepID=UPI003AB7E01C